MTHVKQVHSAYWLWYTYLLTPWCGVLLEKLTGLQLVKNFPAFHGTRRFITVLTSVRHLSLSWARPIQSIYPHPISWRSILILSTHLRLGLPSRLFPSGYPTKTLYTPLSSPIRATCPAHLILLDFITRTILGEEYKSFNSSQWHWCTKEMSSRMRVRCVCLCVCKHNIPQPGRIACCSAPNSRPPTNQALHTTCGNNISIVSSSWWWAYKCPKHVEQIISAIKHSVASSWFSSLRLYYDARTNIHQIQNVLCLHHPLRPHCATWQKGGNPT